MTARLPIHAIDSNAGATDGLVLAVEPITERNAHTEPHRHSFTQLVFIEHGTGFHAIDFTRIPLAAGDIHVLAPDQVHAWDAAQGLLATAAMFSEPAFDEIGPFPNQLRELIMFGAAPITTDAARQARLRVLLRALGETGSIEVGRHLMLGILWECFQALEARAGARGDLGSAPLTRRFLEIAMRTPHASRSVAECAARLGVTPGHLTEQITAATGSTPGQLLRTALTREAQRQLSGTEMTILQISTFLGFSTPSYFSRFFRREAGCSPREYRLLPPSSHPGFLGRPPSGSAELR